MVALLSFEPKPESLKGMTKQSRQFFDNQKSCNTIQVIMTAPSERCKIRNNGITFY